jgi:hypothetical protein
VEHFKLYKQFLPAEALEPTIKATNRLIQRFYDEHHIAAHSAYFSDQTENRSSYAFSVWNQDFAPFLPAILTSTIAESSRSVALLNQKIGDYLGVSQNTRLLLNVQKYMKSSKPVPKHFDGEYFKFSVEGEVLKPEKALRPQKVAVLVLCNDTDDGGTRLHLPDGSSQVVVGEPGDLLVFRNDVCFHSVDALEGSVKRPDGLLRMTIGWRALDESMSLYEDGAQSEVTIDQARSLHTQWLSTEWPKMYRDYLNQKQDVAF